MLETFMYYMPFLLIAISCLVLKYSCDLFEQSAGYLGRNMPAGIKGATINAVGSSMPEMMSAFAVLFFYDDPALFAIALGITAGSGVFNTAVIPSLSILFAKDADGGKVDHIELNRKSLMRDGFWVVLSDIVLIAGIFTGYITIGWCLALIAVWVLSTAHIIYDAIKMGNNSVEEYEDEQLDDLGLIGNILSCNFNKVFFGGRVLNTSSALVLLAIAIVIITGGSHLMVEGVIGSSSILGVPEFISGLILGAAASSIPDLILSLKDARKGDYEDAVANPLASNTFDTSISVGLPLLIWLLLQGADGIDIVGENMEALRISVVGMSAAVCATLIFKYKRVTKVTAWFMLSLYAVWGTWIYAVFG